MAVSSGTYQGILAEQFGQFVVSGLNLRLIVFDEKQERIVQWIGARAVHGCLQWHIPGNTCGTVRAIRCFRTEPAFNRLQRKTREDRAMDRSACCTWLSPVAHTREYLRNSSGNSLFQD